MTNIIINEKEYDTKEFTDEQKALVSEAQFLAGELNRAKYTVALLTDRNDGIVKLLEESLEGEEKEGSLILPEEPKLIT